MASCSLRLEDFVTEAARRVLIDGNIVFFLGAGCSRAAGIPVASELMDLWAREYTPRGSYSTMMEERYPMRSARNAAFRKLCNGKQPTAGHHALAELFASFPAQIRLCLTTNFDGLVEAAIDQRNHADGNQRHTRMHHVHKHGHSESTAKNLRHHLELRNVFSVVKLHGDALSSTHNMYMNLVNLKPLVEPVRMELLKNPTMLVFIGYGGNDSGALDWLRQIGVEDRGVYWCSQNEPAGLIAPWLREKLFKHVAHRDFDDIMTALATRLLRQQPAQQPQQLLQLQQPDLVVCFVCGHDEAATVRKFLRETEQAEWELVGSSETTFRERTVIRLAGQAVQVWLAFATNQDPDYMHVWLAQLVRQPPWSPAARVLFLMTGVCAGERGKCRLGDLMVATMAVGNQTRKIGVKGEQQPAPDLHGPPDKFVQWVELTMKEDRSWVQPDTFPTVASAHDSSRPMDDEWADANAAWLQRQGFPAKDKLQQGDMESRFHQALIDAGNSGEVIDDTDHHRLSEEAHKMVLRNMQTIGDFPQAIPPYHEPEVHYGVWGSGSAVRADGKVFQRCETIAMEMDAAAFYKVLSTIGPEATFLAIKGVCNFADELKDDSFQDYGERLSAAYALAVARKWAAQNQPVHVAAASSNPAAPADHASSARRGQKRHAGEPSEDEPSYKKI